MGELGQEPAPHLFVKNLSMIFKEVYRILKPSGSFYLNIDDSFAQKKYTGIKRKSMMMVPERLSLSLMDAGFLLRNKIIWKKANAIPDSANDRYSTSYELMYFFTKTEDYFFEQQFEPFAESSIIRAKYNVFSQKTDAGIHGGMSLDAQRAISKKIAEGHYPGRNCRDVWEISTKSFSGSHFAVFNEDLISRPIMASCPQFICTKCGTPRKKIYQKGVESGLTDCGCGAEFVPGIVLDPFSGSGTTFFTSNKLGRNSIGIELNPEYLKLSQDRIDSELGLFNPLK